MHGRLLKMRRPLALLFLLLPQVATANTIINYGGPAVVPTALTDTLVGPLSSTSGTAGQFSWRDGIYLDGAQYAFIIQAENTGASASPFTVTLGLPSGYSVSVFDQATKLPVTGVWVSGGTDPASAAWATTTMTFSFSSLAAGAQTSQFGLVVNSSGFNPTGAVLSFNGSTVAGPLATGAATPEPSTMILFGSALVGVVLKKKKRT